MWVVLRARYNGIFLLQYLLVPRKRWKEEVERDLQVLGVRRWRELVTGKNGGILLDGPKPAVGCSANGEEE
jgi:hypothetical protein